MNPKPLINTKGWTRAELDGFLQAAAAQNLVDLRRIQDLENGADLVRANIENELLSAALESIAYAGEDATVASLKEEARYALTGDCA